MDKHAMESRVHFSGAWIPFFLTVAMALDMHAGEKNVPAQDPW